MSSSASRTRSLPPECPPSRHIHVLRPQLNISQDPISDHERLLPIARCAYCSYEWPVRDVLAAIQLRRQQPPLDFYSAPSGAGRAETWCSVSSQMFVLILQSTTVRQQMGTDIFADDGRVDVALSFRIAKILSAFLAPPTYEALPKSLARPPTADINSPVSSFDGKLNIVIQVICSRGQAPQRSNQFDED